LIHENKALERHQNINSGMAIAAHTISINHSFGHTPVIVEHSPILTMMVKIAHGHGRKLEKQYWNGDARLLRSLIREA
jgi:hypothetical protein